MAITKLTNSSITGTQKYVSMLAGNPGYVPPGFESIASATASSVSTITLSSIPQEYQHLQLRCRFTCSWQYATLNIKFNGVGSGYAHHWLAGNGSGVSAGGAANSASIVWHGNYANVSGTTYSNVAIMDFHDYALTTKNKTIRIINGVDNNGTGIIELDSGFLNSTSAITSISITDQGGGTFTGSFDLYGIKAA